MESQYYRCQIELGQRHLTFLYCFYICRIQDELLRCLKMAKNLSIKGTLYINLEVSWNYLAQNSLGYMEYTREFMKCNLKIGSLKFKRFLTDLKKYNQNWRFQFDRILENLTARSLVLQWKQGFILGGRFHQDTPRRYIELWGLLVKNQEHLFHFKT